MEDIFDYISNYGELSFAEKEFCEIDALVLAQLAYIPFDGIAGPSLRSTLTIGRAAHRFFDNGNFSGVIWKNDPRLLSAAAACKRFKSIKLSGYVNEIDEREKKQFSAVVFTLKKDLRYIAFRGTDHSFVGWEEDFLFYSRSTIPSQKRAMNYFSRISKLIKGRFILGGHSKGGNLALYIYEHCGDELKKRIKAVYNFDGPSLNKELRCDLIHTFVPQSSVFGIMLNQGEDFSIVKCKSTRFNQHDITAWRIERDDFVYAAQRSSISHYVERALDDFVSRLTLNERGEFIHALFKVFRNTGKNDFDDILKNPTVVISSFLRLNKRRRRVLLRTFGRALKSAGSKIFNRRHYG